MFNYKNILFDLDGTLIDSAPGIEESFYFAYINVYKKECPQTITTFIGPPIDQVLRAVNGEENLDIIKCFVESFKQHYDNEGYKKSKLYEDVESVLQNLLKNKFNLFIATNKRIKPTNLILKYLSIDKYFKGIYCPDFLDLQFQNKTDLIAHILKSNSFLLTETIMIGDTKHDGLAADENKLDFAFVEYGYGHYENYKYKFNNIKQILNIL
jgi:phosphoglycolate phosphatase